MRATSLFSRTEDQMTARTRPLNIKLISHKQLRALKSEALRAARELRNETGGAVLIEAGPRARAAWERLDTALNRLDDFSAETMGKEGEG
jgi:hypothetical protein